jgi:methylenetetrahydrofolate dehydrogenase (NADP+)/methenyltetrahydrofolate cyclohydrolase
VSATIIDGKAVAARVRAEVAQGVKELVGRGVTPGLAVVLVGDDPASATYVRSKSKAARECGVTAFDHKLPATTSEAELLALVQRLDEDPAVDGILVQLPLPRHIDAKRIVESIVPRKDVDGLTPYNAGLLATGAGGGHVPCTPRGCMRLLEEAKAKLEGARALVIGRSNLVGRPVALLLTAANATVTVAHSRTRDLAEEVGRAEILVVAMGKPQLVRGSWVREGAVVIDVGTNRLADGKLVGDVEFEAARERASAITPVPGGVGPMTIAMLLANTLDAARRR